MPWTVKKEIAKVIVAKGADYVLGLKGNQGTLHQQIQNWKWSHEPREFSDRLALQIRQAIENV
jgi:hypothetical protein